MNNEKTNKHFFIKIDAVLVFDKDKCVRFVNNKEFLPSNYISFKNEIGLADESEYLKENKKVVLNWPYKNCVLEGGRQKIIKRDKNFL